MYLERIKALYQLMERCKLCPRNCGVNRLAGEKGFCKTGTTPFVSSFGAHFGEEKPLKGFFGSGTIFFTYCNLGCLYCQNWTISHLGEGCEMSIEELSEIMLNLQKKGCHNINLVTPTHQTPMIVKAILLAKQKGLKIPIVYNCGGYESIETLKLLEGIVDIYMPDIKYMSDELAKKYSLAFDYPNIVKAAIKEMHKQVGDLVIEHTGIAIKGLLVRHLILPNNLSGTEEVIRFISEEVSKNTYLNLMDQYRPCYRAKEFSELSRKVTPQEYKKSVDLALKFGLKRIDGITI